MVKAFPPLDVRNEVIVCLAAMCWALWSSRNDVVFNRLNTNSFVQVILEGRTRSGTDLSYLKRKREREASKEGCRLLEVMVMEVFGQMAWRHQRRIAS